MVELSCHGMDFESSAWPLAILLGLSEPVEPHAFRRIRRLGCCERGLGVADALKRHIGPPFAAHDEDDVALINMRRAFGLLLANA